MVAQVAGQPQQLGLGLLGHHPVHGQLQVRVLAAVELLRQRRVAGRIVPEVLEHSLADAVLTVGDELVEVLEEPLELPREFGRLEHLFPHPGEPMVG